MVSELKYHMHASMEEIAGLDNRQLRGLYFRARDKMGRLKSIKLKTKRRWDFRTKRRRRGWENMFKDAKRFQSDRFKGKMVNGKVFPGFTEEEIDTMWKQYLLDNPGLNHMLEYAKMTGQGRSNDKQ